MLAPHAAGLVFHAVEGSPLVSVRGDEIRRVGALGTPILGAVLTEPPPAPEPAPSVTYARNEAGGEGAAGTETLETNGHDRPHRLFSTASP